MSTDELTNFEKRVANLERAVVGLAGILQNGVETPTGRGLTEMAQDFIAANKGLGAPSVDPLKILINGFFIQPGEIVKRPPTPKPIKE